MIYFICAVTFICAANLLLMLYFVYKFGYEVYSDYKGLKLNSKHAITRDKRTNTRG